MAYPQGIDFRNSSGYVTDPTNCDYELGNIFNATYPRTSAQGNTVGIEGGNTVTYDEQSGNDARIAGHLAVPPADPRDFRFDLPSSGNYNIGCASGSGVAAKDSLIELFDTSSSLGTLCTGTTSAGQRFKDATNTEYTQATWPGSQTLVAKTFSTTICRFRMGGSGFWGSVALAHAYVESAGGGGETVTVDKWYRSPENPRRKRNEIVIH